MELVATSPNENFKKQPGRRVSFDQEIEEMMTPSFDKKLIMRKIQVSNQADDYQDGKRRRSDKIRSYYSTIKLGNFNSCRELKQKGFSPGLIKIVYEHASKYPVRIHCDEKGFSTIDNCEYFSNPKWAEEDELGDYSAKSSITLNQQCKLWLSPRKQIGPNNEVESKDHKDLDPITSNIKEIFVHLNGMRETLEHSKKHVSVTISIDKIVSLPREESPEEREMDSLQTFIDAVKKLESLPIQIVINLNETMESLSKRISLELETTRVVHKYLTEAEKVYKHQKWLNYTIPLHKCRKMGCSNTILNTLPSQKLTLDELKSFCQLICNDESFPDPTDEWSDFIQALELALSFENDQWNPVKRKDIPWINIEKLKKEYGKRRKNRP